MKRINPEIEKPPIAIQMDATEARSVANDLEKMDENEGITITSQGLLSILKAYVNA